MVYEVELKFRLDDPAALAARLDELGAQRGGTVEQRDRYFNHPSRDFAQTDEALRIRSVRHVPPNALKEPRRLEDRSGLHRTTDDRQILTAENYLTYKGPLVDPHSKTRHEIEVPFAAGSEAAEQLAAILRLLGFREVRSVEKRRIVYHLLWEDRRLELTLDEVAGLGTFLEIETAAEESEREAARDSILRLAGRLGLRDSIRKSYLTMLLERSDP